MLIQMKFNFWFYLKKNDCKLKVFFFAFSKPPVKDGNETESTLCDDSADKSKYYDSRSEADFRGNSVGDENNTTNADAYNTADESTINQNQSNEDTDIVIENCLVSFMTSPQAFFIQMEKFDEELDRLQPMISDCMKPYDASVSDLCVGQFQEDMDFYRCKVLDWSDESEQALCYFIDFGNTAYVQKNTITEMRHELRQIKPLALACKLDDDDFSIESAQFKQLEELVIREIRFNVQMSRSHLDQFFKSRIPVIPVRLCASLNKQPVNLKTLSEPALWDCFSVEIKQEEVSVIIESTTNQFFSEQIRFEVEEKKQTSKGSCHEEIIENRDRDEDDDDDDVFLKKSSSNCVPPQIATTAVGESGNGSKQEVTSSLGGSENSRMCANLVNDLLENKCFPSAPGHSKSNENAENVLKK